jgi:5-methylcytosine-specific restriction protein A
MVSGCLGYAESVGRCHEHAQEIKSSRSRARKLEPGRALYATARWRALRGYILNAEPLCRHCMSREHRPVAATDIDHIAAHKGNARLFWDAGNLQPLCAACHHRKTAAERGGSLSRLPKSPRLGQPPT